MGDFISRLIDIIEFIWPFSRVEQWENGGVYWFGRFRKVVLPGVYFRVPWFCDIKAHSIVPAIVTTPRLDVMLKDGALLSFTASAWCQVANLNLALNTIDKYWETSQEALTAVLADKIADVDPSRLEPSGRGRLVADLRRWVNEETMPFGVEITKLRFTTFVMRPKLIRLVSDMAGSAGW